MSVRARFVALTLLIAAPLAAMSLTRTDRVAEAQEELATGRALYLRDCAVCHGTGGEGTFRGPDIRDAGTASVDFYLRTGRMPLDPTNPPEGSPPRGEPAYPPDEIDAVVAYVDDFVRGPDIREVDFGGADVALGAELYLLNCAGCHQAIGTGGALAYGRNAPTLTHSSPVEVAQATRIGPGTMPPFPESILDEDELAAVVAYVHEINDPTDRGGWPIGHFGPVTEGLVAWTVGLVAAVLVARWLGTRRKDEPVG